MSVATQLELDDPHVGLLAAAHHSWSTWVDEHEGLGVVADLADLPAWLTSNPGQRNAVLNVIAGLASPQESSSACSLRSRSWCESSGCSTE